MTNLNRIKQLAGLLNESYNEVQFEAEEVEEQVETEEVAEADEGEWQDNQDSQLGADAVEEINSITSILFDMVEEMKTRGKPNAAASLEKLATRLQAVTGEGEDDYDDSMSPEDNVRQVFDREPQLGADHSDPGRDQARSNPHGMRGGY